MKERKTTKQAVYTLEEKEEILSLYLSGQQSTEQLCREYDIGDSRRIRVWRDMKLKYGKIVDGRGKKKEGGKNEDALNLLNLKR